MARAFELTTAPLAGRNLVEASAGTGKTYSLAGLFLRLVVEEGLGVDEILVVTFTEAATEELRGRIRARLREAQEAFRSGDPGGDVLLTHLLTLPDELREAAPRRLTAALSCFDDAAISTIHGFCQRVLAERAFECGAALGAELLPDPSALLEELVADHWRQHLQGSSPGFARYVAGRNQGLEDLAKFVRVWAGRAGLEVVPKVGGVDLEPAETRLQQRFEAVAESWDMERDSVLELLHSDPALQHRTLKRSTVEKMGAQMDAYLAGNDPLVRFDWLPRFGTAFVETQAKPGYACPERPFFAACQALQDARQACLDAYDHAWIAFRADLLAFAAAELPARKARQGVRTFDDLLHEVHRALAGPAGERLADALRGRFRAALIDEFQDTDPLQYGIFQRVFGLAPEPRLFLIGDPKQAIYGFRGADLFAYLGAARAVDEHFTLVENWRSTADLLAAVEQLFSQGVNPFVLDEIAFVGVAPGGGGKSPLVLDGAPDPEPLQVWWIEADPGGKLPVKKRVVPYLCRAAAAEVLRLVVAGQEGRATIDGVPLEPGQVAVLVRTHDQAREVQQALTARRIPSVIASGESLFASAEASEMLAFVAAIAEPAREGRVRAALATELVGVSARVLHSLRDEEKSWEEWLDRFRGYHDLWRDRGLVAALRGALAELGVRERLLAYPDGERRVTNVLHLVEVLHGAAAAGHLGPEAAVGWLGRRVADREEVEEYQLRLETDEKAVQVVTVHRSKGLEYPVVLCPFLWEGLRDDKDAAVACHDPADPTGMILDLGSTDLSRHRALARWEALAERVRLAYVALTRARQRCYLAWGAVNKGEDAALGYLLHAPAGVCTAAPEALVRELVESAKTGRDRYRAEMDSVAAGSRGTLRVAEAPQPPPAGVVFQPGADGVEALERRPPPAAIPRDWEVTSYSALAAGRAEGAEHPDRDEGTAAPQATAPVPAPGAPPRVDIFAFPRGARAGTCLHAILEELDFPAAEGSALEAVVDRQLRAHGFDPDWTPAVAANVAGVLTAPLLGDPLLGGGATFRLRDLEGGDRLTELEFHLPLGRVTPEGLARCLADGPDLPPGLAAAAASLGFKPLRGLLKGFVDLVFRHGGRYYLLDWKSNHLGDRVEAYGSEALARAMDEHHYHLQYLLYAAALHRYLGHRMPGYRYAEHFGAAVYVFLRGVDVSGRYGIFQARPTEARVEALARYLERGEGGDA